MKQQNIVHYNYVILFKNDNVNQNNPILYDSDITKIRMYNKGSMHLFDKNLVCILPAIKYCLHMPRIEFDLLDTDSDIFDLFCNINHNILILSENELSCLKTLKIQPTLIIYADNCSNEVKKQILEIETLLNPVSVSNLSTNLLIKHYNILYNKRVLKKYIKLKETEKLHLLSIKNLSLLPILFLARQYENTTTIYNKILSSKNIFEASANLLWNTLIRHNTLLYSRNFKYNNLELTREIFLSNREKAIKKTKMNVVITLPGIPNKLKKHGNFANKLPDNEMRAIKLIATHCAISKNALLIELPLINNQLFEELNKLELNCKRGTNNQYIHRTLRKIGQILEKSITKEQMNAIKFAKHITVFSDFPIGLAILEKAQTPLQCYKQISQRHLSPLTRCLQVETLYHDKVILGKKCKIAFAECVPNNNENQFIRQCSNSVIHSLKNMNMNHNGLQVEYCETLTIDDLKQFIRLNQDADVLHISAHGFYKLRNNIAGLMIGEEHWMGDDIDCPIPPIVILSACHISPRGSGTVNVADMFLRAGAKAVLGTLIPINARRDSILINRLYVYIVEAQKGSTQYKTLADAWSGILSTNAIHEIAQSSPKLLEWISSKNKDGITRLTDFCLNRSKNRLHGSTIYNDTISILKEMLHDEGMDGKFDNILNNNNYFPESYFYYWIGFTENILLYE